VIVLNIKSFRYLHEDKLTLKDIRLKIREGSVTALLGETGSGKTTLILTLNGVIPRYRVGMLDGNVVCDGLDTKDHDTEEIARHIGIVFDDPTTQIVSLTVEEDVTFGPANLGLPREEVWRRVEESLEAVRLKGFNQRNPMELSGGEQQRLSIAGILAMRPKIIVMDEPIAFLDPIGKSEVLSVIKELNEKYKTTILISESGSDIERIAENVDRILLIRDGEIIADGAPREIFANQELIKRTRLRIPQVAELALRLGISDPNSLPLSVREGYEYLIRLFKKRKIKRIVREERPISRKKPIIEIKNLHYAYPGVPPIEALRGVNLTIYDGEMLGLIGQNGSGKTTLSYILVGLLRPTNPDAQVIVDGIDVANKKTTVREIINHINYVFQNPKNQLFSQTVIEEVRYGLRNQGLSDEEVDRKAKEALDLFEIGESKDSDVESLPLNMKTFLAMASTIAMDPKVLIIDEPTTGLDWDSSRKVAKVLKRLNEKGKTIIMITHNMELVAEFTDRLLVMNNGRIIMDGPTRDVLRQPEKLREAYLEPPQITRLSQIAEDLGFPSDVLTVDEMHAIINKNMV